MKSFYFNSSFRIAVAVSLFAFCFSFTANGHDKLRFSKDIEMSEDPQIIEIAALWKSYFTDRKSSGRDKSFDISRYWNREELEAGMGDILWDCTSYGDMEYFVFDIQKIDDEFYEISCIVETDERRNIDAIYKVCAKDTGSGYRLFNYFYWSRQKLLSFHSDYISFYYPHSRLASGDEITESVRFLNDLIDVYDLRDVASSQTITYIFSDTTDECNTYLGLPYTWLRSHYPFAGFAFGSNKVILSRRANHLHEIVHANFLKKYPKAPMLIHEGIATFYGGAAGLSYREQVVCLESYLKDFPETDLSDYFSYNNFFPAYHTNPFGTVGALIIEKALEVGGHNKVSGLFNYTSLTEMFLTEFALAEEEINGFLYSLLENSKSR